MKIEIYSKSDCPFCQMAKQHLHSHGIAYTEQVYDDFEQRQAIYDALRLEGHHRTMPQIFLVESDGRSERIGGYTDLIESDVIARHHVGDFNVEF